MTGLEIGNCCAQRPHLGANQYDRNWAGSRLAGSLRGQMNSCRLGRSGRLAVAANIAAVRS